MWNLIPSTIILITTILAFESNWLPIWMMMEMNNLMLLTVLMMESKKEMLMGVFLMQSLSSCGLVLYLFMNLTNTSNFNNVSAFLLMASIMMKIGMFPFHLWMMKVSKNLYWNNFILMMTWQKMIPMVLLMKLSTKTEMKLTALMSMVFMSVIFLKTVDMKCMMVASSSLSTSWAMMSMKTSKTISMAYFLLYLLIITMLMNRLMKKNTKTPMNQTNTESKSDSVLFMMSLSGMPPSMGFLVKVMVLSMLMKSGTPLSILIGVLFTSSMAFLSYFKMMFKKMMESFSVVKTKIKMMAEKKTPNKMVNFQIPILMVY